jgi:hypothetical protein
LAIDGRVLLEYEQQPPDDFQPGSPQLAVGARAADVSISKLEVWRDVYYTPPAGTGGRAQHQLGPSEYYLLGDNSPHSLDSRSWQPPGVAAENIIGRAVWW